jgi:hypothetical protein
MAFEVQSNEWVDTEDNGQWLSIGLKPQETLEEALELLCRQIKNDQVYGKSYPYRVTEA